MKKSLILLLILAVLGAVAYYASKDKKVDLMDTSDRQFAYPDVNDISKIELKKVDWDLQTFTYEKGHWYINGRKVSDYKINTLLKGITSTRVENLPSKEAYGAINSSLAESGVHVKVYNKAGKKVRSYRIGPDALNDRCTYFIMDGYDKAYCMNIAGFGSVRTRFVQDPIRWWDVAIFEVNEDDIQSVKMEYNKDYVSSFEIVRDGKEWEVIDIGGKTVGKAIDKNKVRSYLAEFRKLNGEGYDNSYVRRDSILSLVPFATISLTKKDGSTKVARLFPVAELIDPADMAFDAEDALTLEKYFVGTNTGDFMVAQQRLLKHVLRPYDYFLLGENQ